MVIVILMMTVILMVFMGALLVVEREPVDKLQVQ